MKRRVDYERHRRSNTPEYLAWESVVQRCCNPAAQSFALYGARGIGVCERWRGSFLAFLAEVGERPSPAHSLDRVDNDRGYEPGNVRWATAAEQNRNRRGNRFFTFQGETLCLSDWAVRLGIRRNTLEGRLYRAGWSVERAFTEPVGQSMGRRRLRKTPREAARDRRSTRWVEFGGERLCVQAWSERLGMDKRTLLWRLRAGWPVERVLTEGVHGEFGRKAA